MLGIAANISMLFREIPLLDRFQAARDAGFDGVEMQFPYAESAPSLTRAAQASGMPVVLMNAPIEPDTYPFGMAGRPEKRHAFRTQLAQVCEYAAALNAKFVHILAGTEVLQNERPRCLDCFVDNLVRAADVLGESGIQVLIEPLNAFDAPNYLLGTFEDARAILDRCDGRVGLQFDVYHAVRMGLDPVTELKRMLPWVCHVQFADVPGRHEPGTGNVSFEPVIRVLSAAGYRGWLSAEYLPIGTTAAGLQWLESWRAIADRH